jgi:hypothetical protein
MILINNTIMKRFPNNIYPHPKNKNNIQIICIQVKIIKKYDSKIHIDKN